MDFTKVKQLVGLCSSHLLSTRKMFIIFQFDIQTNVGQLLIFTKTIRFDSKVLYNTSKNFKF